MITAEPLLEVSPLLMSAKGVRIIPFDKRSIEDLGLVKLDLLSLRTLSAIDDAILIARENGESVDYDGIPMDDVRTYEMIGRGETIGSFQLESPAQRALHLRLKPDNPEDLVAAVALIRPGPIKGRMVEPFLERRLGREPVTYLHPKLEPILKHTYGVVLYQEQVIQIATVIAGFSPGEADELRRVMSHARSKKDMESIGEHFVRKAIDQGVDPSVAHTIFQYIQGYASYGFCEAHAAAFGSIAYKTAYLIQHYPAAYFASILTQYPMGYYPVHVVVAEAKRRGVQVLGVDINESEVGCTATSHSIRLGFKLVRGMKEQVAKAIARERGNGPFQSPEDFCLRVPSVDRLILERLILVGAFDTLFMNRRELAWNLEDIVSPGTFRSEPSFLERSAYTLQPSTASTDYSLQERLIHEYSFLSVGISGHWVELYRPRLQKRGVSPVSQVGEWPSDKPIWVAGMPIRPHRPPTKSGQTVVFFSLEDESGMVDVTMFQRDYRRQGAAIFAPGKTRLCVHGKIDRSRGGPQIIADRVIAV